MTCYQVLHQRHVNAVFLLLQCMNMHSCSSHDHQDNPLHQPADSNKQETVFGFLPSGVIDELVEEN